MAWIRSFIFFIGYIFIGLVITPIMLFPSLILPYTYFRKIIILWGRMIIGWLHISTGIRFQIIGQENLNKIIDSPCVIISNHQSAFETLLFPTLFPPHSFILKKELLHIPFVGWGLRKARQIAIDRRNGRQALKEILSKSRQAFSEGRSVVIFPEGTRVSPKEKLSYKKGGFILAKQLQTKILPISHNAGLAWERNSFIKHKGTITITIGKLIDTNDKSVDDLKNETESWIRAHTKITLD